MAPCLQLDHRRTTEYETDGGVVGRIHSATTFLQSIEERPQCLWKRLCWPLLWERPSSLLLTEIRSGSTSLSLGYSRTHTTPHPTMTTGRSVFVSSTTPGTLARARPMWTVITPSLLPSSLPQLVHRSLRRSHLPTTAAAVPLIITIIIIASVQPGPLDSPSFRPRRQPPYIYIYVFVPYIYISGGTAHRTAE